MHDLQRPLAAFALLLAGCSAPLSRNIEGFEGAHGDFFAGATTRAPVKLSVSSFDEGEVDGEPGSFDVSEVELEATLPIPLGRDDFLIGGVFASRRSYEFDSTPLEDEDLGIVALRFGYGRFIDDDLVVQAYIEPSVYSDFDGSLGNRDYRLWYGTALAIWRQRPDLYWKVGFQLNDAVDTAVIPLIGAVWHLTEKLRVEALLPRDVQLVYTPSERWILSGGFANQAYEYHLEGPSSLGSPEHDVHTQEAVLFVDAERLWSTGLSTFARVGFPVGGTYDWDYGAGFDGYEGTLDSGTVVTVGLGYRF